MFLECCIFYGSIVCFIFVIITSTLILVHIWVLQNWSFSSVLMLYWWLFSWELKCYYFFCAYEWLNFKGKKFIYVNLFVPEVSINIFSRITIGGGVVSSQVDLLPFTCLCTVFTTLSPSSILKMLPLRSFILDTHSSWFSFSSS